MKPGRNRGELEVEISGGRNPGGDAAHRLMRSLFKFRAGSSRRPRRTVGPNRSRRPRCPATSSIPLHQSIGGTRPIVQAATGSSGQKIGEADGNFAAVHARLREPWSTSAPVVPHPSGLAAPCVVIEPDGLDDGSIANPVDISGALTPEAIREALRDAGLSAWGRFSHHGKLTASKTVPMEELVINGAECEPFITCDDLLMRERAEDVVRGPSCSATCSSRSEC